MPDLTSGSSTKVHHLNIHEVPSPFSMRKQMPIVAQQTHVVYTKIQKMARYSNRPLGYLNQTTWSPQKDPPVPLISLPRKEWDINQFVIPTGPSPVWIDLVINNLDEGSHPFHMVRYFMSSTKAPKKHIPYLDTKYISYSTATTSTSSQPTNLNTAGAPTTPSSTKSHPLSLLLGQIRALILSMTQTIYMAPIMIRILTCTTHLAPLYVTQCRFPAAVMQCSASRLIIPVCGFCIAMFFGIL